MLNAIWEALVNLDDGIINHEPQVSVYPNPVLDRLNIQAMENGEGFKVLVKDMQGKHLYEGVTREGSQTIDLSALHKGLYIMELRDTKGRMVKVDQLVKI